MRVLYNGITSPFQGEVRGSTPLTRSFLLLFYYGTIKTVAFFIIPSTSVPNPSFARISDEVLIEIVVVPDASAVNVSFAIVEEAVSAGFGATCTTLVKLPPQMVRLNVLEAGT